MSLRLRVPIRVSCRPLLATIPSKGKPCKYLKSTENYPERRWQNGSAFLEKRLFANDFMTAHYTPGTDVDYSPLSMAVFEDSGWYRVNYTMTNSPIFGAGRGCDFVLGPCMGEVGAVTVKVVDVIDQAPLPMYTHGNQDPDAPEFCTNIVDGSSLCSSDRMGKGVCRAVVYEDRATNLSTIPLPQQYFRAQLSDVRFNFVFQGTERLPTTPASLGGPDPYMVRFPPLPSLPLCRAAEFG